MRHLLTLLLVTSVFFYSEGQIETPSFEVESTTIEKLGKTKSVRELIKKNASSRDKKELFKKNRKAPENFKNRGKSNALEGSNEHQGSDPLRQFQMGTNTSNTTFVNQDGLSNTFGSPHDPSGDIGNNHYVQAINSTTIGVYDKTGQLLESFNGNTLWSEFNVNGRGDPIILFDEMSERWMITEFAGPALLLIAISDTDDPLGEYSAYRFSTPNFPDYPKYAIWPNAIVVTTNESGSTVLHNYLIQRDSLMAGADNVQMQRIAITGAFTEAGFFVSTPVDFSGSELPSDGRPMVMRLNDSSWGQVAEDVIEIHSFDIDWTSSNNTQVERQRLVTTPYDGYPCSATGPGFACMPQKDGQGLDGIPELIMNIPQYRRFENHESTVLSFITDVTNGQNLSGIRWMELRKQEGDTDWSIYQEGTYSPDGLDRFMPSIAMDERGNIGLAYNVTSDDTYVGIRYTGRFSTDPLGQMTVEEVNVVEGTNRINSGGRFGDYAQMGTDPVDGRTFWYTGEYAGNGGTNSRTRILSFQLLKKNVDAKTLSINSPVSSQDLSDAEQVSVTAFNNGLESIENLEIGLIFEGETVETFQVPVALSEGDSYDHTFTTTLDLSAFGEYPISVYSATPNDEDTSNDTLVSFVQKVPEADAAIGALEEIITCNPSKTTSVQITNAGQGELNQVGLSIIVNESIISTPTLDVNLSPGQTTSAQITLDELVEGLNDLRVEIASVNGMQDIIPSNNSTETTVDFEGDREEFTLVLQLDNAPEETDWVLQTLGGTTLAFGGQYTENGLEIRESFCLAIDECYRFRIFDGGNDGICCGFGNGSIEILNPEGEAVATDDGQFGAFQTIEFCTSMPCAITVDIDVEEASEDGVSDGSIFVNVEGGVAPYLFSLDGENYQENPLFEGLSSGDYTVSILSNDGDCLQTEEVTVGITTSVQTIDGKYAVTISPNPGNGFYSLAINNLVIEENWLNFQVLDINGKLVQEGRIQKYNDTYRGQISLVAYPQGTYFVRLLHPRLNSLSRLIKL